MKARREGLEPINDDIAAAEVVKDMAEHESNLDMKGKPSTTTHDADMHLPKKK